MSAETISLMHQIVWMAGGALLALPALGVVVRLLRDLAR